MEVMGAVGETESLSSAVAAKEHQKPTVWPPKDFFCRDEEVYGFKMFDFGCFLFGLVNKALFS